MAATFTKLLDGDVSLGSWNGELMTMQPAAADYPTGGYPIVDGVAVVNSGGTSSANCDLYRVIGALYIGGCGGYRPVYNPATKKIQVFQSAGTAAADTEVAANTDLSAFTPQFLLFGL